MSYANCRYAYAGSRAGEVLAGVGGAHIWRDGFDNQHCYALQKTEAELESTAHEREKKRSTRHEKK